MSLIVVCFCFSFEMSLLGSIAVDMRWLTAGAAYAVSSSAHLPVKFEISADLSTEQFVGKVFPPKTVSNAVHSA